MKHTNRGDDSKNGQRNPSRTRPILVKIIGRESADERTKDKEREYRIAERLARWTKITGIATIVAAFGAVLAAGIFYMQLGTMQAQLTTQEVDFRIDQRPIIVDDTNSPLPPEIRLGITYNESTSQFGWNYSMKNVGKTTAFSPTSCEYISVRGGHFKTMGPCRISNDLGPSNGTFSTAIYPETISKDDLAKLFLVPEGIIVKVLISYKDVYGTSYDAFICYINNGNHTVGMCSHRQVDQIPTDENK